MYTACDIGVTYDTPDCVYNEKLEKWFRREFSIEEKNTYYFDFDHPYNIHKIYPDFS